MLTARDLHDRLPALRRHAYLLTGARTAADAVVAIAIASLPRDAADGKPAAADETVLFQALAAAARRVVCVADGRLPPLHERLMALPFLERQVLILTGVEGLDTRAAALACDCPEATVRMVLARAHAALAAGEAVAQTRARA